MDKQEFEDKINMSYCDFWCHVAKLRYEAGRRRIITVAILCILSATAFAVDIRDYGAVSGADDVTAEVQAAIDDAGGDNTGGVVFVPSGTWNFESGLEITDSSGITITGSQYMGQDTVLNYFGSGTFISVNRAFCEIKNLRIIGSGEGVGIYLGTKRENRITNCKLNDWAIAIKNEGSYNLISGVDIGEAGTYGYLHVSGLECKLRDVYITGKATAHCIEITNAARLFTVQDCTLSSCARGINTASCNILRISGTHFEGLTEYDVTNTDGSASTLMEGCRADGTLRAGSAEVTLINNWFSSSTIAIEDVANSNWAMLNNRNLKASHFTGAGNLVWLGKSSPLSINDGPLVHRASVVNAAGLIVLGCIFLLRRKK